MALVVKDRVRETTATTGTGTLTLGGAVSGFQDFSVIGNGNTTYYAIVDAATGSWEVGLGTYTSSGTTLSRDTVLESSNNGNLVPFLSGTKDVFCTYPAERSVYVDGSSIVPATAATLPTVSGGTGLTSFTTNQVFYASSTSAIGQSANLTFNGTTLTSAGFSGPLNGTVGASTPNTGAFTTLSATGVTTVQAGTVSAPAITTSGDTNTGIFFPAADTIAFTEGGVESMRIDSAGNVGLGVTPSAWSGFTALQIQNGALFTDSTSFRSIMNGYYNGTNWIYSTSNAATRYEQLNGIHRWFNAASGTAGNTITWTQAMTLDASGNLGIGTSSPLSRLDLDSSAARVIDINSTNVVGSGIRFKNSSTINGYVGSAKYIVSGGALADFGIDVSGANNLIFGTNDVERARINSSGNLGLGVTPSAWVTGSRALQVGSYSALSTATGGDTNLTNNVYLSAVGVYTALTSLGASRYQLDFGAHKWYTAPSGTAGNAITFTQAMTLNASGNLGIGTTSPGNRLHVSASNGDVARIDGTTRSLYFGVDTSGTMISTGAGQTGVGTYYSAGSDLMYFMTGSNERMRIASDGVITSTLGGMQVISGTSVSASGTAVQFTGLPSWVKRITIMLSSVSTNGSSGYIVQLGTGSTPTYVTSGYLGSIGNAGAGSAALITAGFGITGTLTSASTVSGAIRITLLSSSSNTWTHASVVGLSDAAGAYIGGSSISLASVLTAVRVTTVTGINTFDTGTINILYE